MYHIKNDKRCRRSAEQIAEALRQLLAIKPFMEISVSDLQRISGVGRSTFYRLFDNIDDVITFIVDEVFKDIVVDYAKLSWKDFTMVYLSELLGQRGALVNIVRDGKTDLLIQSFNRNLMELYRLEDPDKKMEAQYSFAIFSGACISILRSWDENGRVESIDKLADILERFLNYEALAAVHSQRSQTTMI